jgi:hypothetical protein
MLVVAVGAHSQKGKIKALLQKEQEVPTPPPLNSHQSRAAAFFAALFSETESADVSSLL